MKFDHGNSDSCSDHLSDHHFRFLIHCVFPLRWLFSMLLSNFNRDIEMNCIQMPLFRCSLVVMRNLFGPFAFGVYAYGGISFRGNNHTLHSIFISCRSFAFEASLLSVSQSTLSTVHRVSTLYCVLINCFTLSISVSFQTIYFMLLTLATHTHTQALGRR